MDAQLYIDNFGFSPRHPQPPAYIKVRTKFKTNKEFDRLFLAQELRSGASKDSVSSITGSNPAPQSGSAATKNPIWATEFSKDGKYLAAGGQDQVVRIWAVLSSAEERRAHEKDDNDLAGEARHLSAPVFQQKPYREYNGHTSTILDLSWSKVCAHCLHFSLKDVNSNAARTTSCYPLRWTKLYACGTSVVKRICAPSNIRTSFHLFGSILWTIASSLLVRWTPSCGCGVFRIKVLHILLRSLI